MNKEYIKALSILENVLKDINRIYDNAECEEFEYGKACKATEKLLEDIEIFIAAIKYYSKNTKEGCLRINKNDRYSINDTELSSGRPLEVYNEEYNAWEAGKVEHSSQYGGYYFYNYDGRHISLSNDMKARIRA